MNDNSFVKIWLMEVESIEEADCVLKNYSGLKHCDNGMIRPYLILNGDDTVDYKNGKLTVNNLGEIKRFK